MENNIEDFKDIDLIKLFNDIRPSLKFNSERNLSELNNIIQGFLNKVVDSNDDLQIVYLSMEITKSRINDIIKIRLLNDLNVVMYKLHNNEKLKAEKEVVSRALQGIL